MAEMEWLDLIKKLSHYVALAGAYATVLEVTVQLILDWLSR